MTLAARRVVLASGNPGKLRELRALLADLDLTILAQADLGVGDGQETGLTFVENAIIKARHAARVTGLPAIADDSGIEVDALGGSPGVFSARYAGSGADDRANLEKLLADVADVPDPARTARFHCVMVYLRHGLDPTPLVCDGVWEGRLLRAPRGSQGFGYDPIFFVPTHDCTCAELAPAEKNRISHRARAAQALSQALREHYYRTPERRG